MVDDDIFQIVQSHELDDADILRTINEVVVLLYGGSIYDNDFF